MIVPLPECSDVLCSEILLSLLAAQLRIQEFPYPPPTSLDTQNPPHSHPNRECVVTLSRDADVRVTWSLSRTVVPTSLLENESDAVSGQLPVVPCVAEALQECGWGGGVIADKRRVKLNAW